MSSSVETVGALVHPHQLEVQEWSSYALVIDARSPREYEDDHVPGAVNLPVVDNDEYAEVGTTHRTDQHAAYLIGVEYSLRNIAAQIKPLISRYTPKDRFLVYCFRGGKRSRLWADNLRTIGFEVDVLPGGWKNYRRWVRAGLERLPRAFSFRVLCGPTGCGKTRVLQELSRQGHQVLDLEALACHRGSLLGDLPGRPQPTQKLFDSVLLDALRHFDTERPIWVEAESKKIGEIQLPEALYDAMHGAPVVSISTPMAERVRLWREDYPHFAADPIAMVGKLEPLKPLVGAETLTRWRSLAAAARVDELFEDVMTRHYDPCYARSTRRNYGASAQERSVEVVSLAGEGFAVAVQSIARS
ncbi:MAG: tRNA 2-selenouridine(34) synthase MnmH [Burkholderiaceae bacterium]|nr:tRNA 2-selenouridine(34) synthase MnmH [Burkholderiaceae bacterium]